MKTIEIKTLKDLENFVNAPRPQEAVTIIISSPEVAIELNENPDKLPITTTWRNPLVFGSFTAACKV